MESLLTLVNPRRTHSPRGSAGPPGIDDLVLDRYRLRERLGAGGFGVVWRAHDELLHREVAVKRVSLGPDGDGERASREALATARLAHPAIVALYEACAVEDAFYLISELVHGSTLAELIASRALCDEEVLEIGIALACALAHAHTRGVIHRDIKPQNVLVPHRLDDRAATSEGILGAAKLTDFGGASLIDEDVLTRTGDVLGTLAYMAPEQSEGREVAEEADLYALALVLYEALCGINPVRGATPAATARRIGSQLPALERRRADLSRGLTRALDQALSPSPGDRGSLEQLRLAIEDALERGPTRSRSRPWRRRSAVHDQSGVEDLREQEPPALVARRPITGAGALPQATHPAEAAHPTEPRPRLALSRRAWLACAAVLIVWQASAGRLGVALLVGLAVVPFALVPSGASGQADPAVIPRREKSRRVGCWWLGAAIAPVLGLAGLAGAYPAIAGQAGTLRRRATLGALGYWWLTLAEPLLARRLWLGGAPPTPARAVWEGSLSSAAVHVAGPMLNLGVLLGATLWALGAAVLPWIVRGRSAAADVVAATIWSAFLVTAAPLAHSGLSAHAVHASPRGAIAGAVLGGVLAVAARALRGPV